MEQQPQQQYRRLNNLKFSNINDIKQFIQHNIYPKTQTTNYKRQKYAEKYGKFQIQNNQLIYEPLNLIVAETDEQRQQFLKQLYDDNSKSLGWGFNGFYKIVRANYLNISRKDVEEFLKAQIDYQVRQPYVTRKFPRRNTHSPTKHGQWI